MGTYSTIAILLSLFLLYGNAVAEPEATLSDRGKTALGVSLPSPGGMSIWRVRPTTMWGFEMSFSTIEAAWQRYTDRNPETVTMVIGRLRPSIILKQFSPLRDDVAPFLYQTASASINRYSLSSYEDQSLRWSIGAGLGIGVAWFPFKRVSLWLRQGTYLQFSSVSEGGPPNSTGDFEGEKRLGLSFRSKGLYALVHF